jgi:serine O-acetyltransferase
MMKQYGLIKHLLMQIHEDWIANNRDWTQPGFRALAVYRVGHWAWERSEGVSRSSLLWFYRIVWRYVRNHYGIEIPHTTLIGRRLRIAHQNGIVIHPYTQIGDDCIIRQNVTIGAVTSERFKDAPRLGHRVDVGAGAVILGKVTIGDGAKIGPNTVIMTNVLAGATVFVEAPRMIQMYKVEDNGKPAGGVQQAQRPQPR